MKYQPLATIFLAAALALPGTANAQEIERPDPTIADEIEQISPGAQRAEPVPQLGADADPTEPLVQLNRRPLDRAPPPQLAPQGDRRLPSQLYRGGRTAQPLEALSNPGEGRTAAVAPVSGEDRCDPAEGRARRDDRCARVIETRSAEFTRPNREALSPEQRLLAEQRNRTMSDLAAARRLATNRANPNEFEDQAVASVALAGVPGSDRDEEEQPAELSSEVAAIVQAIVQAMPK